MRPELRLASRCFSERNFLDLSKIVSGEIYPARILQLNKNIAEVKVGEFSGSRAELDLHRSRARRVLFRS